MFRKSFLYLIIVSTLMIAGCFIEGDITDEDGVGIAGVTVTLSGDQSRVVTTRAGDGKYRFGDFFKPDTWVPVGNYIVTPSKSGYSFSPTSNDISITMQWSEAWSANVPWPVVGMDFVSITAVPVNHYNNPNCLDCHTTEANEVHASVHYQWQGDTPYMVNGSAPQGKLTNGVNSYCINILGNWNKCGACHVGKGAMPEPIPTQAQLENIDCLKCHGEPGVLPTRADCLTCHANAGGGDAVKRGDIALAHGNTADRTFDVHMASTGGNLECRECHTWQNHKVAGKGSDLRPTDLDLDMSCGQCHGDTPHSSAVSDYVTINQHTTRVACQSCHIPLYAKNASDTIATEATETHRTWLSTNSTAAPFHPSSQKANNLIPEYRFWDGFSDNYLLGDAVLLDPSTESYPTSRPEGDVHNDSAKLYPFKYKTAEQPMTLATQELIALDTSVYFANGDADSATQQGLTNMGLSANTPYEWVITDTYQLLNHEVSPSTMALSCQQCHLNVARMDLQGELGYAPSRPRSTCATGCHSSTKSRKWDAGSWNDFEDYHDKHVTDKGYGCERCHVFTRP